MFQYATYLTVLHRPICWSQRKERISFWRTLTRTLLCIVDSCDKGIRSAMQFWKTIFAVIVITWSAPLTGLLRASPEDKRSFRLNSVLDLDKPNEGLSRESWAADAEPGSIDHRSRRKRTAATAAEQAEILNVHNSYRQKEGASDMYHLVRRLSLCLGGRHFKLIKHPNALIRFTLNSVC